MDDYTDNSDEEEPQNNLLPIEPMQIVPFPDFNNLQPMIPDEVQIEDLLGFANAAPPLLNGNGNQNLNFGMA